MANSLDEDRNLFEFTESPSTDKQEAHQVMDCFSNYAAPATPPRAAEQK